MHWPEYMPLVRNAAQLPTPGLGKFLIGPLANDKGSFLKSENVPGLLEFVNELGSPRLMWEEPLKMLTFLNGGNDTGGVFEEFRKQREEYLLSLSTGDTKTTISERARRDRVSFALRICLPLIELLTKGVSELEDYALELLSPATCEKIWRYREILSIGGSFGLQRNISRTSADEIEEMRRMFVARKVGEMQADGGPRPLKCDEWATIENAVAEYISNSKEDLEYKNTLLELENVLRLRCDVWGSLSRFFSPEWTFVQ